MSIYHKDRSFPHLLQEVILKSLNGNQAALTRPIRNRYEIVYPQDTKHWPSSQEIDG